MSAQEENQTTGRRGAEIHAAINKGRLATQRQNFAENQEVTAKFANRLNHQRDIRTADGNSITHGIVLGYPYPASQAKTLYPAPWSTLKTANLISQSPKAAIKRNTSFQMSQPLLSTIKYITWAGVGPIPQECWMIAHCAFISMMYTDRYDLPNIKHDEVYSAYATLMSIYIKNQDVEIWNAKGKPKDIKFEESKAKNSEDYINWVGDLFPGAICMSEELEKSNSDSAAHVYTLTSLGLQTMCKHVQDPGYQGWFKARYTSAANTIGRGAPVDYWMSITPNLGGLQVMNQTMSSSFEFRKYIFEAMSEFSKPTTLAGTMFQHTVSLFAWAEATYVATIDRYLVNMAPELFTTKMMEGEEHMVATMLQFMNEQDGKGCFVKLLKPADECYPIHRALLNKSIIAATLIAKKCEPSYQNYVMSNTKSEFHKKMSALIDAWFQTRDVTDQVNFAEDPNCRMSPIARKIAVQKIERMLEDVSNYEQTRDVAGIY